MSERGGEWFEDEGGNRWWWARCEVAGCKHFVCLRLSRTRCYVHAANDPKVKAMIRLATEAVKEKPATDSGKLYVGVDLARGEDEEAHVVMEQQPDGRLKLVRLLHVVAPSPPIAGG